MSWDEREYADDPWRKLGKPGGDWQGLRPTLDNPMSWALPLFRASRITVRIHLFFIVYIAIQMLRAVAGPDSSAAVTLGAGIVAVLMASLFLVVLLHEFGHCIACRRVGGSANEILMWPLGGLAYCQPPNHWRAHFITAAGGPLVNVIICLIVGPLLGLMTGRWWGVALPDPLYPLTPLVQDSALAGSPIVVVLMCINAVSFVLLLFNLLPMFPLDGGRLLQSLLWPRYGYANSMRFAVRTGFVGGVLLAVFGAVFDQWMLVGIAIFGLLTCYITHKQLEFTEHMMGGESEEYATSVLLGGEDDEIDEAREARPSRSEKRALKQAEVEAQEQAQVDAVLAKIAATGLDSLTAAERKLLNRATEKKRKG